MLIPTLMTVYHECTDAAVPIPLLVDSQVSKAESVIDLGVSSWGQSNESRTFLSSRWASNLDLEASHNLGIARLMEGLPRST